MMGLDLPDGLLVGISAFYAIVNIPEDSLPLVFREMQRVLQPGGMILLAFHVGDDAVHVEELWGRPISLDFFLFHPLTSQSAHPAYVWRFDRINNRKYPRFLEPSQAD